MKFKTTLVLLSLVIALGLVIWLTQDVPEAGDLVLNRIFPALNDAEARKKIDRVEIERLKEGKREKIVIEKIEENHWEIAEPIEYRADKFKASGVVTDLGYAEKREIKEGVRAITAGEGEELKLEYSGLDEKSAAFTRLYVGDELKCERKVG